MLVAMTMLNAACYKLIPLDSNTPVGAKVVLVLNDRGRAALADSIGPAVDEVEGTLRSTGDSVYQLDVRAVRYLKTAEQQWSGEHLSIPGVFVSQGSERRLDRKRSWLAGLAATTALAVAILGVKLIGGSSPQGEGPDLPPSGQQ